MKFHSISSSQKYGWLSKMGMMLFCLKQAMRWVYNLGVNTIIIFNHDPLQKTIVPPPLETCLPRTIQRTTLFESLPNSLHNSFNKLSQRRKTWKHFPVQINCTQVLQQHSYGGGGVNVNAWTQKKLLAFLLFKLFVTRCLSLPVLLQVRTLWFVYIEGK